MILAFGELWETRQRGGNAGGDAAFAPVPTPCGLTISLACAGAFARPTYGALPESMLRGVQQLG